MRFPTEHIDNAPAFPRLYMEACDEARQSIDPAAFDAACDALADVYRSERTVFVCGNGGATAIANHMVCDHGKLIATGTSLRPRVISLSHANEMITAIANDLSYDQVFAYQLKVLANAGDLLVVISGSGESPNVVKALEVAKELGVRTIAMTAFSGGACRELAEISLHVDVENYGIAEDVFQSLMQAFAQYIRLQHMDRATIGSVKF